MNYNRLKYSRGQQIVFVVLACFIIGGFIANWGVKRLYSTTQNNFAPDSALIAEIELFEKGLDSLEWLRQREFTPKREKIILPRERFEFDPNTIDSLDILRLGFKPFMAHNWLQYRRHGGKIYSCKKLRSIFGIDTLLVDSLCALTRFESVRNNNRDSVSRYVPKKPFNFELNSADTTLLSQLPGIGSGRAKMIVNRRNVLGGFYSPEQLKEIENIPDSIVDNLIPYISIELDSLKKIDINKSSIKRLHRHPYIDYYQAKAIYDLRWDKKHKGKISDLEELRSLKEFENDEFERAINYLTIE